MTAPAPQTVEDRERERAAEYGKYVAVQAIDINGVRAFNVGDAVPIGHVDRGVVHKDSVRTVSSKAGQQAVAAVTDPTPKG